MGEYGHVSLGPVAICDSVLERVVVVMRVPASPCLTFGVPSWWISPRARAARDGQMARARSVPLRFCDSKVRQGETYQEIPSPSDLARSALCPGPTHLLLRAAVRIGQTQAHDAAKIGACLNLRQRSRRREIAALVYSQGCGGGESGGCLGSQLVGSSAIWGTTAAPEWLTRREAGKIPFAFKSQGGCLYLSDGPRSL